MQKYVRSLALIARVNEQHSLWLCQWCDQRACDDFVSGERRADESFRDCIDREVAKSLGLQWRDFLVANMAQLNMEFAAVLPGEQHPYHVAVAFYIVHLYHAASRQRVASLPNTKWLTTGVYGWRSLMAYLRSRRYSRTRFDHG